MALQLDTFRGHPVFPPPDFPSPDSVGKPVLVDFAQAGGEAIVNEVGTSYALPALAEDAPFFVLDITRRTATRTGFVLGIQTRVPSCPREYIVKQRS